VSEDKPSADADATFTTPANDSPATLAEATSVPPPSWGSAPGTGETDAGEAPTETPSFEPEPAITGEPVAQTVPTYFAPPVPPLPVAQSAPPAAPALVRRTPAPVAEPPMPVAEPPTVAHRTPAPPAEPSAAPAAPADEPKKKRGVLAGTVFAIVVVVLLAAIGYVVYQKFFSDPTRNAAAGNCLANLPVVAVGEDREVPRARIVPCNDSAAQYVVEARLDKQSEAQAKSTDICKAYPNSTFIYRAVPPGGTGYVLCLKKLSE
jgi:hypothetical protein